jgi:hypothetical protein
MTRNTEIFTNLGTTYCRSYSVIIAKEEYGQVYLDKRYWQYSVTTSKHRRAFLCEGTEDTRKKIANGTYILADLNGGC